MTREERLELLKQIEKDIYVCSIESTFLDDAKSCAIHSVIEELEQEPTDTWSIKNVADALARHGLIVEQEPKEGHWISLGVQGEVDGQIVQVFTCSECGAISIFRMASGNIVNGDICPNCGARMAESEDS